MNCLSRVVLFLFVTAALASAQSAPPAAGEDFSTPSLATNRLHPAPPELVEHSEEPGYVSEWITVSWRADDPIYLYVVRPTGVKKPPVVVYLYDYPAETDVFRDDDWCARTTAGGYAAVGFVPALSGHRYHNRPMKEWFVSELQEALGKSAHDVQMVLNYLAERGDVDMNNVGMFGVGAGATIATAAASADSRIKALDLVDPWGDWPVWMAKSNVVPEEERSNYLKPDFLQRIAAFDPVALLPGITIPRVRLNQSAAGSGTPQRASQKIAAALPAGAEHHFFANSAQFDQMAAQGGSGFDWIKQQLKVAHSKETGTRKMSKTSTESRHPGLRNN